MNFKTKIRDSHAKRSPVAISTSAVMNTGIKTLQPQVEEQLPQRLEVQVQRINQLSTQLETAIQELKAIANDLKHARKIKQVKSVCEYSTAVVPYVKHKGSVFVLTTRPIDLFRAEREAIELAKDLRRRAKTQKLSKLKADS